MCLQHTPTYFVILLRLCAAASSTNCVVKYRNEPFAGYRCITESENYRNIPNVHSHMCRHICVTSGDCSIVNYNRAKKLCLISSDPCIVLQKDTDYEVNYISNRKRDSCIQWVSNYNFAQAKPVTSMECDQYGALRPCYVGRRISPSHILPGKYHAQDSIAEEGFWTVFDGQIYTNGAMEILDVQADCQVTWMSLTAGDPVPINAVVGGYVESSDFMLYVIRGKIQRDGNMFTVFGYYDPATEKGYLEYFGVRVLTVMDVLILIWSNYSKFNARCRLLVLFIYMSHNRVVYDQQYQHT